MRIVVGLHFVDLLDPNAKCPRRGLPFTERHEDCGVTVEELEEQHIVRVTGRTGEKAGSGLHLEPSDKNE